MRLPKLCCCVQEAVSPSPWPPKPANGNTSSQGREIITSRRRRKGRVTMAQGNFASRIFQKYCKNSLEQRGQDSEQPRVSEFTVVWDNLSKWRVSRPARSARLPPQVGSGTSAGLFGGFRPCFFGGEGGLQAPRTSILKPSFCPTSRLWRFLLSVHLHLCVLSSLCVLLCFKNGLSMHSEAFSNTSQRIESELKAKS